jgi:hypothetical protein
MNNETTKADAAGADAAGRGRRATAAERAARVELLVNLRLNGGEIQDALALAAEQGWGIGPREVHRLVRKADRAIVQTVEKDRERLIGHHVAKRRALYARCVADGDYRGALAVLDSEAQLLGLFAPKNVNLSRTERTVLQVVEVIVAAGDAPAPIVVDHEPSRAPAVPLAPDPGRLLPQ